MTITAAVVSAIGRRSGRQMLTASSSLTTMTPATSKPLLLSTSTTATSVSHSHHVPSSSSSSSSSRFFSSAMSSDSDGDHDVDDSSSSKDTLSSLLFNPTEDHIALRDMMKSFTKEYVEPRALEYNKHEKFNYELFQQLGTSNGGLGILGLTVPEKFGGTEFPDPAVAVAIAHEELSYSDPSFCLSYLAHSLLLVNNLTMNANHEQCNEYLPRLCDGSSIGGMCMSEPHGGTDVLGCMKTIAKQGDDGDWILNGTKMWITNGYATDDDDTPGDVFLVYARTGPNKTDITQFIVTNDMKGFTVGQRIKDKLGMRSSNTAELVFENVKVPKENIVGKVNGATICMMRNLEIERLGLASMAIGISRRCIDEMKVYANERSGLFNQNSLYNFGQIQKHISESVAEYYASKCYVYSLANILNIKSSGNTLHSDGVKLFSASTSKNIADRAIQVMGGYGYVGEYVVERLWRDSKLLEIGGGTNESHHKNMSRDLQRTADIPIE